MASKNDGKDMLLDALLGEDHAVAEAAAHILMEKIKKLPNKKRDEVHRLIEELMEENKAELAD